MNLEIVSSQVTENPTNRSWNKYIWKNLLELVCLVHISIPFCLSTLLSLCVRLSSSCRGLHTSIPYHCLLLNTSSYPEPFWILWSRQVYLQAFAPFFFSPFSSHSFANSYWSIKNEEARNSLLPHCPERRLRTNCKFPRAWDLLISLTAGTVSPLLTLLLPWCLPFPRRTCQVCSFLRPFAWNSFPLDIFLANSLICFKVLLSYHLNKS